MATSSHVFQDRQESWIRRGALARVFIAVCLAVLVWLFQRGTLMGSPGVASAFFTTTLLAIIGAANLVQVFLLSSKKFSGRQAIWVQVAVDLVGISTLVYATGGLYSNFIFLYIVAILAPGIVISRMASMLTATIASVMLAVVAILHAEGLLPSNLMRLEEFSSGLYFPWNRFVLQVFAFYLTALLSGYWSYRLRNMQVFQEELLDHMNSGFITLDAEGRITMFNRAAGKILSCHPVDALGASIDAVVQTLPGEENPFWSAIRRGRECNSREVRIRTANERVMLVGITISQLRNKSGKLEGIIAGFADLTEVEKMRNDLRIADKLAAVGELSAGMAHEIRNPVAAIRGAVEELFNSLDKPQVCKSLATIAVREADQLNNIVSGFLEFARIEQKRNEAVEISQLLDETAGILRMSLNEDCGVNIATDYPPNLGTVLGDRGQLKQMFINLGMNGIEAMKNGGQLTIWARKEPVGHTMEIWFSDEGEGIQPEALPRLFEPFFTTKTRGVGMGLAIVHKIVSAHHGIIKIENRPKAGTIAKVALPLADKPIAALSGAR